MLELDKMKILRGKDIIINDFITLLQPNIGDITEIGEQRFFSIFHSLCGIPSDMKSVLFDAGIDYMKISDWEYFLSLCKVYKQEDTALIFGDLDFSKGKMFMDKETGKTVLMLEQGIITEEIYEQFIPLVREMIGYTVKREKAANKFTKKILIDEDREKRQLAKGKKYESFLFSIVLSLVNTEEFPYNYETVFDCTIYQIMKSFLQIQNKKSACALYQGSMSGFVDTSKINKANFSWVYSEDKFKTK